MSLRSFVTRGQSQVAARVEDEKPVAVSELLPWKVTDISYRPFDGFWSFNPSLHFDGHTWRCSLRCADYALPDSVEIRGPRAQPNRSQTRNAMLILDPDGWQVAELHPMQELDGLLRLERCASTGFEDLRLFQTSDGVLRGVAAALHLGRDRKIRPNSNPPVEQVLLDFDDHYNIARATPLRGSAWEGRAQKNWVPFEGADIPCFLFAVERGIVVYVDAKGDVVPLNERAAAAFKVDPPLPKQSRYAGGPEVRISRPFVALDHQVSRTLTREYKGLRGGTQLLPIGDDRWLGLAHAMRYSDSRKKKYYWHQFYVVDDAGMLVCKSKLLKLAPEYGIEFASGLALDGDRAVISYGTDDMNCWIGETSLAAILELLGDPLAPIAEVVPEPEPEVATALSDEALGHVSFETLRAAYRALRDQGGQGGKS
jgi:hypothetical protein